MPHSALHWLSNLIKSKTSRSWDEFCPLYQKSKKPHKTQDTSILSLFDIGGKGALVYLFIYFKAVNRLGDDCGSQLWSLVSQLWSLSSIDLPASPNHVWLAEGPLCLQLFKKEPQGGLKGTHTHAYLCQGGVISFSKNQAWGNISPVQTFSLLWDFFFQMEEN